MEEKKFNAKFMLQKMTNAKYWLALAILLLFTACTEKSVATNQAANPKTKIVVGTSASPKPFTFVATSGQLSGYDIDVVKAIFQALPEYEVSYEITEFPSVLASLDANRFQIAANNFALNKARQEKYIYSQPIFKNNFVIAVAQNRTDIHGLADLAGKTTEVSPGLNYATFLEKFNHHNPQQKVKINYSEADLVPWLRNVEAGKFDFHLVDNVLFDSLTKEFGINLKAIQLNPDDENLFGSPYSYLLFNKLNPQLVEQVNQQIAVLSTDGTLKKISEKYFGKDYSPSSW